MADLAVAPYEPDLNQHTLHTVGFHQAPYKDVANKTSSGNLTINGFLSEWALMTLIDPRKSLSADRKKQRTERNVFQCFVFGPKKSGKSALLDSFLGSNNRRRYAANVIDQPGGTKKTLVLREIREDRVKKFLANKESLASCDVAVVVYDSSDVYSWKKAREILMDVARRGEESGHGTLCLLVATKDDLDPYPMSVQESDRIFPEYRFDWLDHLQYDVDELNYRVKQSNQRARRLLGKYVLLIAKLASFSVLLIEFLA